VDDTPEPDETTVTPGGQEPDLADTTAVAMDTGAVEVDEAVEPDDGAPRSGVSKGVLVVSILLTALVAGVAGLVIGWKVEQQRVKDDLANIRPIGTVSAVEDDSVTVTLRSSSGTRTYEITDATIIAGQPGGDTSELPEGATVLVKSTGGDDPEAIEIVVLPEGTTYGRS
jgi:hypothetical protein